MGRTEYLEVRMTPEEKERLRVAADEVGMQVSDFVRQLIRAACGQQSFKAPEK